MEQKLMTMVDFLNFPTVDLMGWWLFHNAKTSVNHAEDYAKSIAAYDAYGREGIALILSEAGYAKEDTDEVKMIRLQDLKGILTKMRTQNDHRIFSVAFVKKTDGTLRHMECRYGVKKHLKGGEAAYDPKDYDLTFVFDIHAAPRYNKEEMEKIRAGTMTERPAGDYRSISLENIIRAKIGGKKYIVEENKELVNLLKD